VAECDARDAWAPTAPPHQGHMTPRDESVSIQSQGIKKTFSCLWLPVSLCVSSRVHSLLSACTAVPLLDCTLPSVGLSLVNQRRKEVRAGSVCQLCSPLNRPACESIHCPCCVSDQFRAGGTSWKTASCLQQPGCKCPLCRSAFISQGHWDPAKMDRLCTIRNLRLESMGARTIANSVWQTLQRTPLRQWLSLEPPRCYVPPTV